MTPSRATLSAMLALTACGAATPADPLRLEGHTWTLVELFGSPLDTEELPWLRFDAGDDRVHGSTGINRWFADYQAADGTLEVGSVATTRRAGPPAAMRLESSFLRALDDATTWTIEDGDLRLSDDDDQVVARLRRS